MAYGTKHVWVNFYELLIMELRVSGQTIGLVDLYKYNVFRSETAKIIETKGKEKAVLELYTGDEACFFYHKEKDIFVFEYLFGDRERIEFSQDQAEVFAGLE